MEALEFKLTVAGNIQNHGGGVGIVGGELRVHRILCVEQNTGTVLVAEIGIGFAGEYRVAGKTQFLGMLYLGIPVGALNQSHHQAAASLAGQTD